MSVRGDLRAAIAARFALIRAGETVQIQGGPLHTFATSVGARVFPWRVTDVPEEDVPCCGFADTDAPGTMDGVPIGWQGYALRVEVTALVTVEEKATDQETTDALVEEATAALGDLLAAIGKDPKWGGLAAWTEVEEAGIEIDPAGRRLAAAVFTGTIHYRAPKWQL